MKSNNYDKLKKKINKLNELNNKIEFIEWNKDDGPKFKSIKEMKEFINKVRNNDFDFIFSNSEKKEVNNNKLIIEDFKYNIDNIMFYIITHCINDKYLTYLSLKRDDEENYISNLCSKFDDNKESAHNSFKEIQKLIENNELNEIINSLLIEVDDTINNLNKKYINLVSEN